MKSKSAKKQKGSGCARNVKLTEVNCLPEPNVSQYKCPCPSLPLDNKFIMKGGCQSGSTDCFSQNLQQIGSTPSCNSKVAEAQAVSQNAFSDRYCCGYGGAGANNPIVFPKLSHGVVQKGGNNDYIKTNVGKLFKNAGKHKNVVLHSTNGKMYTEGFTDENYINNLRNFLVKNGIKNKNIEVGTYSTGGVNIKFKKGGSKSKRNTQKGGVGYYLAINECPIGGLPLVKSYSTCNKPVFNRCLPKTTGGSRKKLNKINKKNKLSKTKKSKIVRKKQRGGNVESNFNPDLKMRDFGCKQPQWGPDCI